MLPDSVTVSIPSEVFSARPIVTMAGGESTAKRSATATEDLAIRSVEIFCHSFALLKESPTRLKF
jgi:hypothetical protein